MSIDWMLLIKLGFAFSATVCYAILYHVPKKALLLVGLVGLGAWLTQYLALQLWSSPVYAAFFGGVLVGALSEKLARKVLMPVTVFVVGGIVPLVPGSSAMATMREFVMGDYLEGLSRGTQTMLIASAISAGLVLAGSVLRTDWRGILARKNR
ncbi:threonine/serine exporter family protein [Tumebacillus lipolyticus]|uniref:Threonine/serine exporter family protein n=1 Tax=Tumebacillus lipolyticus TaxID=1280370 RepID=A0ABW4ZWZ3_9BACL